MSKPMKITDKTYQELEKLRLKGETYSEVIDRLLNIRTRVMGMLTELEFLLDYEAWKRDELLKISAAGIKPPAPELEVKHGKSRTK